MKKPTKRNTSPGWQRLLVRPIAKAVTRTKLFLARRPHRSFRRTRRRDYVRSLSIPGYWSFTLLVFRTIWKERRLLLTATFVYVVASALVVGWASQDTYTNLNDILKQTSQEIAEGGVGRVGEAGALLFATVTSNLNGAVTPESQAYAGLLGLFFWLLIVWLLRSRLAGRSVKVRDGLYNSGAPVIATSLVGLVLLLQMVPLALAVIAYSVGSSTGILSGGAEAMLVWLAIILLAALSLYWSVSTVLALVVVTLPGMYPMQAIKTAGDLVIGRRTRIFLRMVWMVVVVAVSWVVVMIPIILLDGYIKSIWSAIESVPVVPISLLAMSSLTLLFVATYVYLFYRKMVDDDAKPA